MNQRHCLMACALAALGAGAASAQEAAPDTWITEAKSVTSRAEVQSELARARVSGEYVQINAEAPRFAPATATRTRAEVVAELFQAKASGEYDLINAEATPFPATRPRRTFYAETK